MERLSQRGIGKDDRGKELLADVFDDEGFGEFASGFVVLDISVRDKKHVFFKTKEGFHEVLFIKGNKEGGNVMEACVFCFAEQGVQKGDFLGVERALLFDGGGEGFAERGIALGLACLVEEEGEDLLMSKPGKL